MKKFYLNSTKNNVGSLKSSRAIRLLLMVLFVCLFGNVVSAQTTETLTSGTTSWTVPCYVTSITVEAWGGGGGGGAADKNGGGGSGGGGGGYSSYVIAVTPGQVVIYKIGGGGSGGVIDNGGDGGDGKRTTILALIAIGGKGGDKDKGAVGAGGTASGGTTNSNGTDGLKGTSFSGAAGGQSNGLAGGDSRNTDGNGNAAINPGSGGGGGFRNGGPKNDGGNGAKGQIKITYTTSTVVVGTVIQPTCALSTGSVILNNLPASGTWTLTRSPGGVTTSGTGTSTTISEITSGTYTYTVSIGSCISGASNNVVINAFVLVENKWDGLAWTKWNGSVWVSGEGPTAEQKIIFAGDYPPLPPAIDPNVDIVGCSCTVNTGVYVDINAGLTLTLTNELIVVGTILFKDKSSLVQINNVANTGIINYERKISNSILPDDYIYWSSPVSGMNLADFSPYTMDGMFYSYNSSIANWQQEAPLTKSMEVGKGYIIRGPEYRKGGIPTPSSRYDYTFKGMPNNGDVPISVTFTNPLNLSSLHPDFGISYLLGNPYPSALDAEMFLDFNSGFLGGTIYFWTHITPIGIGVSQPGTGVYAYSGADYAAYNSVGGITVGSGTSSISGSIPPSGKIAAGQGFFATCIATGNIKFNNNMRVAGNNSQFFKTKNPNGKTVSIIEKNRVWLNLTNIQGAFKQTLIGYVTDATNEYDSRFDGQSFDGNEFVDFYSVNQDLNLVIQGRALPFDENDEVPLGYRTTIDGDFTINIDQVDGLLTDQAVFIEDKLTNTVFNLRTGNYTFSTVPGTFNDRFVLRYKDNSTANPLATTNFETEANKVLVSNTNKQITINSFAETIDKVTIYDMLGKQIYQKDKVNSNELLIANLVSSHQTLVVKTSLQNGRVVTDKIIF